MFRTLSLGSLILAFVASLGLESTASAQLLARSKARLFGPGLKGNATFVERDQDGELFQRFLASVSDATPGDVLDVMVNGQDVGDITVADNGRGKLDLRTAAFIEPGQDVEPIPDNFPTLDTGDLVTVGPLSGYFFDLLEDAKQRVRLRGDFGDTTGPSGDVRYREIFKTSNGLDRRFTVQIEDAAEGDEFEILLNGEPVGILVATGAAQSEFELRTARFINNDDQEPMPRAFPAIQDGDVVTVGPFVTTMEIVEGTS